MSQSQSDEFDVNTYMSDSSLNGKYVDTHTLFECVSNALKWPKNVRPMLLHCVFTGRAQDAYLSPELNLDY